LDIRHLMAEMKAPLFEADIERHSIRTLGLALQAASAGDTADAAEPAKPKEECVVLRPMRSVPASAWECVIV